MEVSKILTSLEDGASITVFLDGKDKVSKLDGEISTTLTGTHKFLNSMEIQTTKSPNTSTSTLNTNLLVTTPTPIYTVNLNSSTIDSNSTTQPEGLMLLVPLLLKLTFCSMMSLLLVWFLVTTKSTVSMVP